MKLQAINSAKIESLKNTSFKGYETKVKNDGEKIVEFYAPPYDKKVYNVALELVPIKQTVGDITIDGKTTQGLKWQVSGDYKRTIESKKVNGVDTGKFELPPALIKAFASEALESGDADAFGYHFVYTKKDTPASKIYALEPGLKTNNGESIFSNGNKSDLYNVYINTIGSVKKNGPMYHMLPDSYYNVNWKNNPPKDVATRNHFNLLGGDIKGMIEKIKEGKLDSYGLLMTTPLFGADEISSHGYWPTNPYQISSARGDLQGFKDLNVELYKRGVQYVADGAFTSQGLLSPLVQHVIKHGKDSQFIDYFKIDGGTNSETSTFKLHIPILPDTPEDLKNITYKVVEKNGERYVQFYDSRLVSEKDAKNHDDFIKSYDPELLNKHPNINAHDHSVVPYYFNITAETDKSFDKIRANQYKPLTDIGAHFANFAVVTKKDARSANFWDGNLDLVKMNTSNKAVRNYLYNVANYWTKTIANTLLLETAVLNKTNPAEVKAIAERNGISSKDFDEIKKNVESGKYSSEFFEDLVETDKLLDKEIAKFPLESIEFASEITAVLASPDMSATTPEDIDNTKLANYYNTIGGNVETVLQQLDKDLQASGGEKIYEDDDQTQLTTYGAVIAKMIIPDVVKYSFAVGILGNKNVDFTDKGVQIKPNNVGLSDVADGAATPEEEKEKLAEYLKNHHLCGADIKVISTVYKQKFKNVSFNDILLAQAIIEKSGAGLNWRYDAAKDIADLDAVRDDSVEFGSTFDIAAAFWRNFTDEIKKENPNAFTIGEITCVDEFATPSRISHYNNEQDAESRFYEKSGVTTGSNYSYLFSSYPELLDRNTEGGYYRWKKLDNNIDGLNSDYKRFYKAGTLPFINNSHVFTDNHDKPRTMHGFVFNTQLLVSDVDNNEANVDYEDEDGTHTSADGTFIKNIVDKINDNVDKDEFQIDRDSEVLTSRGLAGCDLFARAIDFQFEDKELRVKLKRALKKLLMGDPNAPLEERKIASKALGTRPVEVTMELLLDKAGIKEPDERKKISDELNKYIFKKAFDKYTTLWRMMVAGAGIPTIFNGDEYGQTGYETPNKNQDLGCRNRVLFERENEDNMFSDLYKEINATSNLHKEKGMSALSGGTTQICKFEAEDAGVKKNLDTMVAYKYDSNGSEVLSLFWKPFTDDKDQAQNLPNSSFSSSAKTDPLKKIKIGACEDTALADSSFIMTQGNAGKKFKRKIYNKETGKYEDSKETYTLNKNGELSTVMEDGEQAPKPIVLNAGVNIFYRVDNLDKD